MSDPFSHKPEPLSAYDTFHNKQEPLSNNIILKITLLLLTPLIMFIIVIYGDTISSFSESNAIDYLATKYLGIPSLIIALIFIRKPAKDVYYSRSKLKSIGVYIIAVVLVTGFHIFFFQQAYPL